jgi:hypothetical protein
LPKLHRIIIASALVLCALSLSAFAQTETAQTETPHIDIDTAGKFERLSIIIFGYKEAGIFIQLKKDKSRPTWEQHLSSTKVVIPRPKQKEDTTPREPWEYRSPEPKEDEYLLYNEAPWESGSCPGLLERLESAKNDLLDVERNLPTWDEMLKKREIYQDSYDSHKRDVEKKRQNVTDLTEQVKAKQCRVVEGPSFLGHLPIDRLKKMAETEGTVIEPIGLRADGPKIVLSAENRARIAELIKLAPPPPPDPKPKQAQPRSKAKPAPKPQTKKLPGKTVKV